MRVTGGQARGIPLTLPKGDRVRPATDAMRQAVFSSLAARVPGARFLDLFAGSGAYGLEAWSRGAVGGIFIERDGRAAACLRRNIEAVARSLGANASAVRLFETDATTLPLHGIEPPDLIFVDPPYEQIEVLAPALFSRLAGLLAGQPDALVVFETPGEITLAPLGWDCVKRLGKGVRQPTVSFFRPSRGQPEPM